MAITGRGDRRIHWEQVGQGPAVILLPGIGAGAAQFGTLPRRFARAGYRCLTMSPVGIPPSSPHRGAFAFAAAAADVLAVFDAAGVESGVPVGVSLGGAVALHAAAQAPARVPGLILLGTAARDTPRARRIHRFFEIAAQRLDGDDLAELMLPFLFGATYQRRHPKMVVDILRSMRPAAPARALMAAQARAYATTDLEARAAAVRAPALCVGGGEDTITPASDLRAFAQQLPAGEYVEIAEAGHSLLLESRAVFEHVIAFLRRCTTAGGPAPRS